MKSLYFKGLDQDSLGKAINDVVLILQGSKIEPPFFKDYKSAKFPEDTKKADGDAKEDKSALSRSALMYAAGTQRDAEYCLMGRKQMKAIGYQSLMTSLAGRASAASTIEIMKK